MLTCPHSCECGYDGLVTIKALKGDKRMANPAVVLLMGSDSDLPTVKEASAVLQDFGVAFEAHVHSAHRSPEDVVAYVRKAEQSGVQVFIAAAGGAAHLAGVVAAHTTRPVIGIPIQTSSLGGLDSLLSTVQMPGGVPVATMAIGAGGARNAGLFAVQILALANSSLAAKLQEYRAKQVEQVRQKDKKIQAEIGDG
jgi:phosphoribosylaminoimidazole carboxylase PurE protein